MQSAVIVCTKHFRCGLIFYLSSSPRDHCETVAVGLFFVDVTTSETLVLSLRLLQSYVMFNKHDTCVNLMEVLPQTITPCKTTASNPGELV